MVRLIAFDLEGTLVKEEFLVELAKLAGKEKEIKRITQLGLEGEMDWQEGFFERIKLLHGIEREKVLDVARIATPRTGVAEALKLLKENNFKIAVISGGFDITAKNFCDKFGIDYFACNSLVFENGKLAGAHVSVNCNKDKWLKLFADAAGADFVAAFGDGANDIGMMEAAAYGKILRSGDNILLEVKKLLSILKEFKPTEEIKV